MVVPNEASRLKLVYQFILSGQLPIETGVLILIPPAVKPDGAYRPVVGEQLRQLIVHEAVITCPVTFRIGTTRPPTRSSPRAILAIPVNVRVIKMQADALLVAFVGQLLQAL